MFYIVFLQKSCTFSLPTRTNFMATVKVTITHKTFGKFDDVSLHVSSRWFVFLLSCRNTRGSLGEMRNAVGNQLHFASTTQCKHRKCFLNSFTQHCEEKRKENHSCTLIVIRTYILFTHKNITSTPHARSHLCF